MSAEGKVIEIMLAGSSQTISFSGTEAEAVKLTDLLAATWKAGLNAAFTVTARNGIVLVNAANVAAVRVGENTQPEMFGPPSSAVSQ